MKSFIFLVTVFGSACVFGQGDLQKLDIKNKNNETKTISYFVVSDRPEDLRMLGLTIPIWNASGSFFNCSLYDLNLTGTYYANKFQGSLRYKLGVGDRMFPESLERMDYPNQPMLFSVNEAKMSQELNAVGTYFFTSSESEQIETIHLKTAGNTSYVTKVPVKELTKIGVNFGYAQGFTWYNMNRMKVSYEFDDLPGTVIKDQSLSSMGSVQNYKFLKAGLTFSQSYNFKGNFEGYGDRTTSQLKTTYFNVIFALQNEFDDVYVSVPESEDFNGELGQYVSRASIDAQNKKLPFGFEFGRKTMTKESGISTEFAIKYLPGFVGNINLMIELGASYTFNFLGKK